MNKENIDKKILKLISEGKNVAIAATNGTETIASANDIFTYISPDFKNWGCDKVEPETPKVEVKIYEQIKDATYAEIFGSIDQNLDRLVLTTSQIKSFIINNAKDYFLDAEWTCFRFLFKVGDEFFVADVRVLANGERAVRVFKFFDGSVRHAEYRHRRRSGVIS